MAATLLKTEAALVFGVATGFGNTYTVVLQDVDYDRKAKDSEATGEYGDVIGVAIHGGQRYNVKGTYLYKGTSTLCPSGADMGLDIMSGITGIFAELTGACVLTGTGRKRGHEAFSDGNFEGIGLVGGSRSTYSGA